MLHKQHSRYVKYKFIRFTKPKTPTTKCDATQSQQGSQSAGEPHEMCLVYLLSQYLLRSSRYRRHTPDFALQFPLTLLTVISSSRYPWLILLLATTAFVPITATQPSATFVAKYIVYTVFSLNYDVYVISQWTLMPFPSSSSSFPLKCCPHNQTT